MTPTERALKIVSDAIGPRGGDVDITANAMTTPGWDSLAHVSILMELERQIGTPLPATVLAQLTSVSAIEEFLARSAMPNDLSS